MPTPLVLIADNDRAVSALLVDVLARSGLRTACAYDGNEAAHGACDPEVQVLVCDLDMPGRSGLEVLEGLAPECRPPTVVISGFVDERAQARLDALDFVRAVMRKPFDLFEFADTVRALAVLGGAEAAAGG